jgi:hypothetical protein
MLDVAVAAFVLEKPSFQPIVPGQSSRSGQSNGKTRYVMYKCNLGKQMQNH